MSDSLQLHSDAQAGSVSGLLRWFSTNPLLLAIEVAFWNSLVKSSVTSSSPVGASFFVSVALGWAGIVSYASLKYDFFRTKIFLKTLPALWFPAVLPLASAAFLVTFPSALEATKQVFFASSPESLAIIQALRLVSVGLFFKAAKGAFPPLLAAMAGLPDVVYGLSALSIYFGSSVFGLELTHSLWRWWNIAGIAVVIGAGSGAALVSLPGPFYKFRGKDSMLSVLQFPMVLAPSVVAPLLMCIQVGSLLWTKVNN